MRSIEQLSLFPEIIPKAYTFNYDCRDVLKIMIDKGIFVDSIVTDPPYELGFMGKSWDSTGISYDKEMWNLCLQVLRPGGHLLAFGGSRTYHRIACAIEDAGFEIRDQIMWIYGQGFPKSLNVSKAIDKMAGAEREVVGIKRKVYASDFGIINDDGWKPKDLNITAPSTDAAKQWDGWGSALKPAHEPIVMARKPLSEKNIASNVLEHGTGAINIDGCRVVIDKEDSIYEKNPHTITKGGGTVSTGLKPHLYNLPQGRFPANLIHDGSDEVMEEFAKYGDSKSTPERKKRSIKTNEVYGKFKGDEGGTYYSDSGTSARFFYCAKASKQDRCDSKHPTVKPISLMAYLCRLITPPGGFILDPFGGSGTTGQAARQEGFNSIIIEKDENHFQDIQRRLKIINDESIYS